MSLSSRVTALAVRFRLVVIAAWLALTVAGILAAANTPSLLSDTVAVPETQSDLADSILARAFGDNPNGTFTVVLPSTSTTKARLARFTDTLNEAAAMIPRGRTINIHAGAGVIYGEVATPFDLKTAQAFTSSLRQALTAGGLPRAEVTGPPALQHDIVPLLGSDLLWGQLVALPILLVVLVAVIGLRGAILIPLAFAAATIYGSMLIVFALAHVLQVVSYVPNLVELVGLGVSVDYSLLVVRRFLEEIDSGQESESAVAVTMSTAGRAAIVSGFVVAAGLAAIFIIPVPFIQSLGLAGILIPGVAVLATVTLQPALLATFAQFGLTRSWRQARDHRDADQTVWNRTGLLVTLHPRLVAGICTAALLVLATPAVFLKVTPGSTSAVPASTPAGRALRTLANHVGDGAITPIQVVIDSGQRHGAQTRAAGRATLRLADEILGDREVFVVAIGPHAPYVDPSGRYRRAFVVAHGDFGSPIDQRLVGHIRSDLIPKAHFPRGFRLSVGGPPAEALDFLHQIDHSLPWFLGLMAVLTYATLFFAFRSLTFPLVALLLNGLSASAAYGMLVLTFQMGVGKSLVGLYRAPAIEAWVPVFLVAILFGLSMDYQVFVVSRIREYWSHTADPETAIRLGVARTGTVVTGAGIIAISALIGMIGGAIGGLQEFGFGLGAAIFIDTMVVRLMLLPAVLSLSSGWIWRSPFRERI